MHGWHFQMNSLEHFQKAPEEENMIGADGEQQQRGKLNMQIQSVWSATISLVRQMHPCSAHGWVQIEQSMFLSFYSFQENMHSSREREGSKKEVKKGSAWVECFCLKEEKKLSLNHNSNTANLSLPAESQLTTQKQFRSINHCAVKKKLYSQELKKKNESDKLDYCQEPLECRAYTP